jgi:hypothetical protein
MNTGHQLFDMDDQMYCPMCDKHFASSEYLKEIFTDQLTRWFANMVTHYRHHHLKHWDRMWNNRHYCSAWHNPLTYDEMKEQVNNRAKRQIMRKCRQFLIDLGFGAHVIKQLENNDEATITLSNKLFSNKLPAGRQNQ